MIESIQTAISIKALFMILMVHCLVHNLVRTSSTTLLKLLLEIVNTDPIRIISYALHFLKELHIDNLDLELNVDINILATLETISMLLGNAINNCQFQLEHWITDTLLLEPTKDILYNGKMVAHHLVLELFLA